MIVSQTLFPQYSMKSKRKRKSKTSHVMTIICHKCSSLCHLNLNDCSPDLQTLAIHRQMLTFKECNRANI